MNRFPFSRLFASFLSSALLAGASMAAADDLPSRAPIWKLTDKDSSVYLAGSVHLLREKDLPIPAAFDLVYEKADELVFEIDMKTMMDPATAVKLAELGTLPEGETLSEKLPEEVMNKLTTYLEQVGMPTAIFDRFSPGMAFITLGSIEAVRSGANPELGLESTYYQKCLQDNKPSRGLETAEYQISRFNEIKVETIAELIEVTLDDAEIGSAALDEIVSAWKSGDPEKIAELVVSKMEEHPEVKRILLTERNCNWIPKIEKALAGEKTVLFLVGAAHLAGEDSVIDMLEKKGYQPRQVEAKAALKALAK
ncbi:MAG: TraB/GumN family protein [Verrucomicrobiales bacterium]|nr:TraB/GumN family protein [Verrucomicrobiales bacterium]